jgi:hypothetical protein
MQRTHLLLMAVGISALSCEVDPEDGALRISTNLSALSITDVAAARCDTPPELVDGLSRQLVEAINCLRPGTLADIPLGGDIRLLRAGRPAYIDARGLDSLLDAAAAGNRQMVVRWAYRDVALQHLFWLQDDFRNCAVAAPAGLSNHQNGLAVDLNEHPYWEPLMRREGWENNLPNDRVHFDYSGAEDIGLGALSLLAFQALWNRNHPEDELALSAELDGATYDALSDAPIEGFDLDLCEGGGPPIGPGPVRGPTVAQSAWRGCDAPPNLIEGLSDQIAQSMNCLEDDVLSPLRLCAGAGCLNIQAPPIVEWLGTGAHESLLALSRELDAPITVRWALRDVALQHFFSSAANNIGCPPASPAGRSDFNSGQAAWLPDYAEYEDALLEADWSNLSTALDHIWAYDDEDLTNLNVLAFQRLWNLNRDDDPIDTDGLMGPQTRGAIDRAPVAGFAQDLCGAPDPAPDMGVRPERDAEMNEDDAGSSDPRPRIDAEVAEDVGRPDPRPPGRDATGGSRDSDGAPFDDGRRPDGAGPAPAANAVTDDGDSCDSCQQGSSTSIFPLLFLLFLWRRRVLG